MAKTPQKILQILDQLQERTKFARDVFISLSRRTALIDILGKSRRWAIVGGAVRDILISNDYHTPPLLPCWHDIDIAITQHIAEFQLESNVIKTNLTISENHFGGLKLTGGVYGTIDIWTYKNSGTKGNMFDFWLQQLNTVDFGLNAVAFVWPECQIIRHPQWEKDIKRIQIEKLSENSPRRELQPLRAIALAEKINKMINPRIKVNLGPRILADLEWLIESANLEKILNSLAYLKEKTEKGRWQRSTPTRLYKECTYLSCESVFLERLVDSFKLNLIKTNQ